MSPLICSRMKRALGAVAVTLLVAAPNLVAQTGSIAGQVSDRGTGNPVSSVQVFIADLDLGVLTQQNGSFNLQNVPAGTHSVLVQRLGYREASETVMVTAGQATVLNFVITEAALQLDEVIVTGTPGGTRRRAIGNAVSRLDASDITQQIAVTSMQDLLGGRTPGIDFERVSGNVGTGSPIQIRGIGSFNLSTQPLIYIDGVRVNNSTRSGPTLAEDDGTFGDDSGDGEVSVLDDFNPEDIESIEIIKGPAAATLYGTEASAGVIQIITKKGLQGAPQFNVSIRQGANFLMDPAGKLGEMWACHSTFNVCTADDAFTYNMYDEANKYISGEVLGPDGELYIQNWPTKELYQYGLTQSYNMDVRGGTETIRYFLSAGFEDQEGAVWYNTDERTRMRANVGVVLSDNVSLDVSTGYVDGYTRFSNPVISDGGIWQDLRWANGFCLLTNGVDKCPRLGGFQEHRPDDVADVEGTRDFSRFTGSATLNYTYSDWLTQRAVIGIDKGWEVNRNLYPLDTGESVYSETNAGQITFAKPTTTNFSLDYAATANYDYDEFSFATSVGAQYYTEEYEQFENTGLGFASEFSRTINQTPPARAQLVYQFIESKSLGVYVQEVVGWNDRLFVTGAVRADDNSAFGRDFDLLYYPKVSATWLLSEEDFWNVDVVNSLRVRGAWGKAGRQPNAFSSQNIYSVIPGPGGAAAIRPDSPGNQIVGPEVSTEIEIGFDVAVLDDQISAEFTYFKQKNEDALLGLEEPWSKGFPGERDQNLGRIDSWGWEMLLNTRIYESSAFSFGLITTVAHVDNKIISMGTFPGTNRLNVNWPYPAHVNDYNIVSAEYDPNGSVVDAHGNRIQAMCLEGIDPTPVGAEFPEQYGVTPGGAVGRCQDIGQQDIFNGRGFPTYTASIMPTIGLFDNTLQIFSQLTGEYGKTGEEAAAEWGHRYNNTFQARLEGDPLWISGDRLDDENYRVHYDNDFWRMREIGIRYVLPESLITRTGASRATIAVSGRNLWTVWQKQDNIWGVPIADPEYTATGGFGGVTDGSNVYQMPPLANVSMTLRLTF